MLGSPLAMVLGIRGGECGLPQSLSFPGVDVVANVFHWNDPVAYRLEPLIQPAMAQLPPVLINNDLTPYYIPQPEEALTTSRWWYTATFSSSRDLTPSKQPPDPDRSSSPLAVAPNTLDQDDSAPPVVPDRPSTSVTARSCVTTESSSSLSEVSGNSGGPRDEDKKDHQEEDEGAATCPKPASIQLSHGRRLDFVLPLSPLEAANEYLSSISAHASYFPNPDFVLFLLRILRDKIDDDRP